MSSTNASPKLLSPSIAETAEDVSRIAFGFMASKALFAGLHIDVFTLLSDGALTSPKRRSCRKAACRH